jgi:hypothetical protein
MPAQEFDKWFSYFEWKHKKEQAAEKKSKAKSSGKKQVKL